MSSPSPMLRRWLASRPCDRYPVKSLGGELVVRLGVDLRGCIGDRLWSVRTLNGKIGSGKNTRRFASVPGLLSLRACESDGGIDVRFPDGSSFRVDAAAAAEHLSGVLGQPLTFAMESSVSHFDDGPVSLLGLGSVEALAKARGETVDPGRFRANVLLEDVEPFAEDAWIGRSVSVGTAVLHITMASPRCVMVDMETANLPAPARQSRGGRRNALNQRAP